MSQSVTRSPIELFWTAKKLTNDISVATVLVLSILAAQKRDAALVLKTLSAGSAVQDLTNIVNVALPQEIQKNSRMRDFQNRFVMKWLGISTYTTVFFNQ